MERINDELEELQKKQATADGDAVQKFRSRIKKGKPEKQVTEVQTPETDNMINSLASFKKKVTKLNNLIMSINSVNKMIREKQEVVDRLARGNERKNLRERAANSDER